MKIYINYEKLYVHFRWEYSEEEEEEEEVDSVIDKLKEILKSVTSTSEKDEKLCIDMISAWNDVISKIEQAKVRKWYHFFRSENYDIELMKLEVQAEMKRNELASLLSKITSKEYLMNQQLYHMTRYLQDEGFVLLEKKNTAQIWER